MTAAVTDPDAGFASDELAGLILAAGEGARAGGPKALAVSHGRTWIEIAVALLRAAGLRRVVVVLGARHEEISPLVPKAIDGITVVVNTDWRAGRTGSLQQGWRAIGQTLGVLVHQVDFPEVRAGTVRALGEAFVAGRRREPKEERAATEETTTESGRPHPPAPTRFAAPAAESSLFVPVDHGRRGHPILIGRELWPEIEALGPDEPLRTVVHRDPARIVEIEVDDPGIHANRNWPEPGGAPVAGP